MTAAAIVKFWNFISKVASRVDSCTLLVHLKRWSIIIHERGMIWISLMKTISKYWKVRISLLVISSLLMPSIWCIYLYVNWMAILLCTFNSACEFEGGRRRAVGRHDGGTQPPATQVLSWLQLWWAKTLFNNLVKTLFLHWKHACIKSFGIWYLCLICYLQHHRTMSIDKTDKGDMLKPTPIITTSLLSLVWSNEISLISHIHIL